MESTTIKRVLASVLTVAAAVAISSCGFSIGDETSDGDSVSVSVGEPTSIPATDIETKGQEALQKETGKTVPPISCPEDLDFKVGDSEECSFTDDSNLVVTATVTSADSETGDYELNFKVSK